MLFTNFTYKYTKWILLSLVIISILLRYFTIENYSLDVEEQLLWFYGTRTTPFDSLMGLIQFKPLNLILSITNWITCSNGLNIEIVNRSISTFAGIVSVPLIFILARKFYSEIEGIISAAFITFSWNCINNSQNMAEHSLLLMFVLLYFIALITFLDRISEENFVSKQEYIFLITSGLLLGFTSIWGILIIGISFFYSFFFIPYIKTFLKTIVHFMAIIIPLGLFILWGLTTNIYTTNIYSAESYINSFNFVISNNYILSVVLILPIFYLAFLYIKRLFSKNTFGEDAKTKFHNSTLIITIWFIGSIIVVILFTLLLKIKLNSNDLIYIFPPLFILLARSIALISPKLKHQIIISSIFGCLFLISTLINLDYINNKPEYNQAIRYIMHSINNDKTNSYGILMINNKQNILPKEAFSYYLKKNKIKNKLFLLDNKNNIFDVIKQAKNTKLNYIWFIANENNTNKNVISEIKNIELVLEGYRYKGLTIYKLKI